MEHFNEKMSILPVTLFNRNGINPETNVQLRRLNRRYLNWCNDSSYKFRAYRSILP